MGKMVREMVPDTVSRYFLGHPVPLAAWLRVPQVIIAGSVTVEVLPISEAGGFGVSVPFSYNLSQGFGCGGIGPAALSHGKTFNIGLVDGDTQNSRNILGGWSVSLGGQVNPLVGAQAIASPAGGLFGNTFGTLGFSGEYTKSWCGNWP